jgi:hypothetical protein
MLSRAILLGPQRRDPIVRQAVDDLLPDRRRPVAALTAGWEEREAEDQELRDHVARPVVNLEVWARVERIFERDAELLRAMRERHDSLRRLQELYRLRLAGLLEPLRELMRRAQNGQNGQNGGGDAAKAHGSDPLLFAEQHDAMTMVQGLDAQHVARVAQIHHDFEQRYQPGHRDAVVGERKAIQKLLRDAGALLIAGGHIAVLLHRMRLFDVTGLYGDRPVVAWSAGAMALCERIVLFHDSPPQGSSDPEVMEAGLALVPDFVALPHAKHRLATADALRMRLLAQRFQPACCALLDKRSRFDWDGRSWRAHAGSRQLLPGGEAAEVGQ